MLVFGRYDLMPLNRININFIESIKISLQLCLSYKNYRIYFPVHVWNVKNWMVIPLEPFIMIYLHNLRW